MLTALGQERRPIFVMAARDKRFLEVAEWVVWLGRGQIEKANQPTLEIEQAYEAGGTNLASFSAFAGSCVNSVNVRTSSTARLCMS